MSASLTKTKDPLVVNTRDACWVRRAVTTDGHGLYAVEGSCRCPEFLLTPLSELAGLGIVGTASALPMPAGPAVTVSEDASGRTLTFTARETAACAISSAEPSTVYRAEFHGSAIPLGLYDNREAARKHCETFARREMPAATFEWRTDGPWHEGDDEPRPEDTEELYAYGTHETSTWDSTGYLVIPLEVASRFDEEADE